MIPRIVFGMAVATASLLTMGTNAFVPKSPLKTRITPTRNPNDENLDRILTSLNALSFNVSLDRPEEDRWARTADREESLLDAECILTIGGMRYNMTSWARAHPGGPNILRRFHGKDATTAFDKAGHSHAAYEMLKDFAIGPAESYLLPKQDDKEIYPVENKLNNTTEKKPKIGRWRSKLFTKEDPIGIHKYMGIFSLLHFAFRYRQMLFGDPSCGLGTRLGKGPSVLAALTVIPHGILSASSLIFHTVPKERVAGRPMIWQEFRAHNIIFGLRSVATTLFAWAAIYAPSLRQNVIVLSSLSVIIANILADVATDRLRQNKLESTTATMPYWEGASVETQRKFKVFYAYCQFMATLACMACSNPAWPLAVLLPIQLASLLMTLVRKGLISARAYHYGYTASLCIPYLVGIRTALYSKSMDFPVTLCVAWTLYQLRRKGVSKYLLWAPIVAARIALGDKVFSPQVW